MPTTPPRSASRGFSAFGGAVLLLAVPLVGVRAWSVGYADRLGGAIASSLASVLTPANELASEAQPVAPIEDDLPVFSSPLSTSRSASGAGTGKHAYSVGHARAVTPQRGVRISSAQVLALAARRAMPQAVPVKANAAHPAGLLLRGVSGLGIGMQDGDVLTEAAGQKATSVATVVGVVLAARGRQAPEISGRFFRGGVPFSITVEQPYPKQPIPG